MELNFREYAEAWGPLAGAAGGAMLGGWPGAVVGGALGYGAEKLYNRWKNPQAKIDPKYFVYYRDIDGQVHKELMRNEYIPIGREYEQWNADKTHPYFYYGKPGTNGQPIVVKKTKAGYQNYQRQSRQYGGRQQYSYGQQPYQQGYNYQGYGQKRRR